MKVVVLGATGMLGSMLVAYLSKHFHVVATTRNVAYYLDGNVEYRYLDAVESSDSDIAKAIEGCEWVINAIGAIPQRYKDPGYLDKVNCTFPMGLWFVARDDCRIIQIATDCVYSGARGNYNETDCPNPVDDYGLSKRLAETATPTFNHLRCSIVGPEINNHYNLMEWFLSQPKGATVNGYTNHQWNGITTWHFARMCRGIIDFNTELPHIQHIVPADSVSKYELLKIFAKEFGWEDITIKPVEAPQSINRTLATINPSLNMALWQTIGYREPPTIETMIHELASNVRRNR